MQAAINKLIAKALRTDRNIPVNLSTKSVDELRTYRAAQRQTLKTANMPQAALTAARYDLAGQILHLREHEALQASYSLEERAHLA